MTTQKMKALVYEGPREMNVRSVDVPQPTADEVLIRVNTAGICGSELSGYLGQNSLRKPPLIMGHEFAGTVEAVGSAVQDFRKGDRVTVNPLVSCLKCSDCLNGRQQLCAERKLVGAHQPGAFAEYVTVDAKNVYSLPDHVSLDEGALAEPFACGIHMIQLAGLKATDRLAIVGAGPIGLFALRAAQLFGLQDVAITDLNSERLNIAKEMGGAAYSSNEALQQAAPASGFDAVIDAVGLQVTRQQSLRLVKPGGKVIFSGLHAADSELPINDMIRNEWKLYGAFAYAADDFELAVRWISEGKIQFEQWTERLTLEEGKAGFEKLLDNPGGVAKILLTI